MRRRTTGHQKRRSARRRDIPQQGLAMTPSTAPGEGKSVRGVKLRTVSLLTMAFALACLMAFMAGRPPASAANAERSVAVTQEAARAGLGHDDAGRLLRHGRLRKRKPIAQKFEKSP